MKRLIDADALTDELIKGIEADTDKSIQTTFTKSVCLILCKAIEQQPTVDAVPVIRCKDCLMHGVCRFEQALGLDGYCSQAERRTDG